MGAVKKAASLATGAVSFLVPRNLQSLTYLLLSLGAMAAGFLLYSDKLQVRPTHCSARSCICCGGMKLEVPHC
jgi:hypothetical protein